MFRLYTNIEDGNIHVITTLLSDDIDAELEYAFYLIIGGCRESVSWYDLDNQRSFSGNWPVSLSVEIKLFVRLSNSKEIIYTSLYSARPGLRASYSNSRYLTKKSYSSLESFISTLSLVESNSEVLSQITISNSLTLDVLQKTTSDNSKFTLFCFSGAVPQRDNKTAPFFSGVKLSKTLSLPLIAIDDPVVAHNLSCRLGWYLGNDPTLDLHQKIAALIDGLANNSGTTPILLGGSGGGFAALSIARHMTTSSMIFAINPQVDLSTYAQIEVNEFLNHSVLATENASIINSGFNYKITPEQLAKHDILYLQNSSDAFHVRTQMKKFIESMGKSVNKNIISFNSGRGTIYIGDWGNGHVAAPSDMINFAILKYLEGRQTFEIARLLDEKRYY